MTTQAVTTKDAAKETQAIDKLKKDYFEKNKIILNLTLDGYHAIMNLMAEAKLAQGFYIMRDLLTVGDPQKDKLIKEYNKQLNALKKTFTEPKAAKVTKPKLATQRKTA